MLYSNHSKENDVMPEKSMKAGDIYPLTKRKEEFLGEGSECNRCFFWQIWKGT